MISNRRTAGMQGDNAMNTDRRGAIFVGIMFICATVSSMLGLLVFYQPILTGTSPFSPAPTISSTALRIRTRCS